MCGDPPAGVGQPEATDAQPYPQPIRAGPRHPETVAQAAVLAQAPATDVANLAVPKVLDGGGAA